MSNEQLATEKALQEKFHCLRARIAAHPFLSGLRAEHLETLSSYCMATEFEAGRKIFSEGEIANRFYLVEEGRVSLEVRAGEAEPLRIETIGPGGVLGWSWLFAPYTWHFDARALEPIKAIFFYGTRLREHCEEAPEFGYELLRRVAELATHRLNALQKRLVELSCAVRTGR